MKRGINVGEDADIEALLSLMREEREFADLAQRTCPPARPVSAFFLNIIITAWEHSDEFGQQLLVTLTRSCHLCHKFLRQYCGGAHRD